MSIEVMRTERTIVSASSTAVERVKLSLPFNHVAVIDSMHYIIDASQLTHADSYVVAALSKFPSDRWPSNPSAGDVLSDESSFYKFTFRAEAGVGGDLSMERVDYWLMNEKGLVCAIDPAILFVLNGTIEIYSEVIYDKVRVDTDVFNRICSWQGGFANRED